MAAGEMLKVVALWGGFPGAPGFTNLYFDGTVADSTNATAALDTVHTLFDSVKSTLPADVTISFPETLDVIDAATGDLVSVATGDVTADVVGTDSAAYAAPAGIALNWTTEGIHRAHRVRGRTFLVPLGLSAYQTDGSIQNSVLTAFRAAAQAYASAGAPTPGIWARPVTTPTAVAGAFFPLFGGSASDRAAILRSRRA